MPIPLTPEQRRLRGRAGAYAQHAKYDMREITAKGRQVFRESFAAAVREEHPELNEEEVQRRGDALRRSWYSSISLKSAKARARRKVAKAKGQNKLLSAPELLPDPPVTGGGLLPVSDGSAGDGSGSELPSPETAEAP